MNFLPLTFLANGMSMNALPLILNQSLVAAGFSLRLHRLKTCATIWLHFGMRQDGMTLGRGTGRNACRDGQTGPPGPGVIAFTKNPSHWWFL